MPPRRKAEAQRSRWWFRDRRGACWRYEVRSHHHRRQRQQSGRHYPATEYRRHLGANSSKERDDRKGANTGDRCATALALEAKEQADSKRNDKLLKNLKIHSVMDRARPPASERRQVFLSLLALGMAGFFTGYVRGVFVLA